MSALGSQRVHELLSCFLPLGGTWRAEFILEGGEVPAVGSKPTLTVGAGDGALSLLGTVTRSGLDAPDRPHVVMVGGSGWDGALPASPPLAYQSDAGVRLSTVLRDLAMKAGETIELPAADQVLGTSWALPAKRDGEPALRIREALDVLVELGFLPTWRVDPDGTTRFAPRTGDTGTARATVLRANASIGLSKIGLDAPAAFLPGSTFQGATIRRLVVVESPGELTAELWTDPTFTIRSQILRMVGEAFPALVYGYPRTYTVAAVRSDGRLDLAPPPDAPHLPHLPAVEAWTLGGAAVFPQVGSGVSVVFRDARPSRPLVVGFVPKGSSVPARVEIDAAAINFGTAAARLVREGDIYQHGSTLGPITFSAVGGADPQPTKVKG